jgi:glycerol-3-phosphate dehydrogenase
LIDIIIVGAGVTGCLIARELSRYQLKVLLLEKHSDVADETTKANSAIVHAGFDAAPGSLKARFNAQGNACYETLCQELCVPFKRIGSLVLALSAEEAPALQVLLERGRSNGIPGLELLSGAEVRRREPNLSRNVVQALYAPTAGIVGPWDLAIAAAENAVNNGVGLLLDTEVTGIQRTSDGYRVTAGNKTLTARVVINCAGLFADRIHNLVAEPAFRIQYRRGEYFVLDRKEGGLVNHVIFQCPSDKGKGVLISPTVHGNLLIGPNAQEVPAPDQLETTAQGLDEVRRAAMRSSERIAFQAVITSFAGLRATSDTHDFVIGEAKGAPGFFDVAGIESPGLTAAPAIALHVVELVRGRLGGLKPNAAFHGVRRPLVRFAQLSSEQKAAWIRKDARYGRIVCRCESITEGEIVDAIHRHAGATTLDGVKRRLRPGMGRCQGGFCGPRVVEILARELGVPMTEVRKDGPASVLLTGPTKCEQKAVLA